MSASKKEKTESTKVEQKKVAANAQNAIIKELDKRFAKLAELERRLKTAEERLGLTHSPETHKNH